MYATALVRLDKTGQPFKTWTLANGQQQLHLLAVLGQKPSQQKGVIQSCVKEVQSARETKRKSDASRKGEETHIRFKATSAYKDTGMGHMVRFLYEQGALVPRRPLANCQSDDESSPPPGLSDKFDRAQPDEDQFDIQLHCLFPAETVTGVSAQVHRVVGAITDKRIHEVEPVCFQRMNNYNLSKACRSDR